jgi:hypothetical protein
MKLKTQDLTGAALDWAVTKCELPSGWPDAEILLGDDTDYSTDWSQGGPIIEREGIDVIRDLSGWVSLKTATIDHGHIRTRGPTPLVAAMRCYVASKLGAEVEIPNELMEK